MTKFKADIIFAIALYLAGDAFIQGQAGQELSANMINATIQYGIVLMGWALVISGVLTATFAAIKKIASSP